jgi:outer membrane protein assembly factor BamB
MRRSLFVAFALPMIIGATATAGNSALPPRSSSVAYQQNVKHDGRVREEGLDAPFEVAWSTPLTRPSYPLIADGRAFLTTRRPKSSDYGTRLVALDVATGTTLWSQLLRGTYYWSNAAFDAGRVFVVNADGRLSAFDAATGVKAWAEQLPGQYSFSSAPTASNGVVYVGGAGSGGTLYAVAEADGTILWSQSVQNGDESSPTLSSSRVYVSYACRRVHAFDRSTGAIAWNASTSCSGGGGKTSPYHQGLLYARDPISGNAALDGADGSVVKKFTAVSIPAFTAKLMIRVEAGVVTATYLVSGKTAWTAPVDGLAVSAPIIVNDSVIVASSDGTLWALKTQTGAVRSSLELGITVAGPDEQNVSQPLTGLGAGNGVVLVPGIDTLVALRPA